MTAEQIAQRHGLVTEMIGGGWLSLRPGETTDDTAMTMAVAEGIMEAPESPIPCIGARFIRWANSGPKDIGGTCRASIGHAAFLAGKNQSEEYPALADDIWFAAAKDTAEQNHGRSGGNGALMRAVYPALYYPEKERALQETVDPLLGNGGETMQGACQATADRRNSIRIAAHVGGVYYCLVEVGGTFPKGVEGTLHAVDHIAGRLQLICPALSEHCLQVIAL